jgi:phospholipid/cholesterol/gamma-HCH transport system permease protein
MIAIVVSSFFLLIVGLMMSVFGGALLAAAFSGINPDEYLRHIPTVVTIPSIIIGLVKCLVFAVVLAAICTYKGYSASGGARGVGRAVVETAVATMVVIVVADWATSLFFDTALTLLMSIYEGVRTGAGA